MSERHELFLGDPLIDPDADLLRSNMRFIEKHVQGSYRVRCSHCGVAIAGLIIGTGPIYEVLWGHDGDSYFGTFKFPPHVEP
jgi:hypothetical protein